MTINNVITEESVEINIQRNQTEERFPPFPPIVINCTNDVVLDELIQKLLELVEYEEEIKYSFTDSSNLVEENPKIKIVKETLSEIYDGFNVELAKHFTRSTEEGTAN